MITEPAWAVEVCDADSTANTEVNDFYGPTVQPVPNIGLQLVQRVSVRHGIALPEPAEVVMVPSTPITRWDAAGLRALALAALDLADHLD